MSSPDPLSKLTQAQDFLRAVEPNLPAYHHASFSYVALLHNGERAILRARLSLVVDAPTCRLDPLVTTNLSAGHVILQVDASAAQTCIRQAVANDWLPIIGDQLLKLQPTAPLQYSDGYSAYHEHTESPRSPVAQDRLVLSGINRGQLVGIRSREIGREIQELGFDSLEDLMRIYDLRGSEETTLEITVGPVAVIYPNSRVEGRHAQVNFGLAKSLDPGRFRITIRNADPNLASTPLTLRGDQTQWIDQVGHKDGQWKFDLPRSEIIDCRAVYAGNVQAAIRLADLSALPNPLRNMIGLVDANCCRLEKLLTDPGKNEGRDFEVAVTWLLQLLGFGALHVSSMSGMTGEPDILAWASPGIILIIECTTGVPTDDKLTLLVSRMARMRESLQRSREETAPAEVMGLFITSRPPEEVTAMRRKAQTHSVVVLCRPEIQQAVARSKFAPDSTAVLKGWRELALTNLLTGGLQSHLYDD